MPKVDSVVANKLFPFIANIGIVNSTVNSILYIEPTGIYQHFLPELASDATQY